MPALNNAQKAFAIFSFFLALILRVVSIDTHSIWFDEKTSVLVSQGIKYSNPTFQDSVVSLSQFHDKNTLTNVIQASIDDNGNSILYNLTLHFWVELFGTTDTAVRSLSVVFSMLSLLLIFLFTLKHFEYKLALIVLLLLCVNPLSVTYADEARSYSMAVFFTSAATFLFYELFIKKNRSVNVGAILLYGLFCGCSLLTHYLTAYMFIAHAILALLFIRDIKSWMYFSFGGICALGIFALWMFNGGTEGLKIMSFQTAVYAEMAASYKPGDNTFVMPFTIGNWITGMIQVWLYEFGNGLQSFFRIRQIMILLLLPLALIVFSFWKNKEHKKTIIFLSVIMFTQTLFATFLAINSGHTISFQPLYANFAAPHAILLLGISLLYISQKHSKIGYGIIAIQLCISSYSLAGFYQDLPKKREPNPYLEIAQSIEEGNTLEIVCPKWEDAQMLSLYLPKEKNYTFKINSTESEFIELIKNGSSVSFNVKDLRY